MGIRKRVNNQGGTWQADYRSPEGKRIMFKENNPLLRLLTESEIEALLQACADLIRSCGQKTVNIHVILNGVRRSEESRQLKRRDSSRRSE